MRYLAAFLRYLRAFSRYLAGLARTSETLSAPVEVPRNRCEVPQNRSRCFEVPRGALSEVPRDFWEVPPKRCEVPQNSSRSQSAGSGDWLVAPPPSRSPAPSPPCRPEWAGERMSWPFSRALVGFDPRSGRGARAGAVRRRRPPLLRAPVRSLPLTRTGAGEGGSWREFDRRSGEGGEGVGRAGAACFRPPDCPLTPPSAGAKEQADLERRASPSRG